MTRSADDKLDMILEKVAEMATGMAVMNEWREQHEKRHDRESSWKRWIVPTLISLCSLALVLLKFKT